MLRGILLAALLPAMAHAQAVQYANRSGAITTGGQSQQLTVAWAARRGCMVQNTSAGDLWVRVTAGGGATLSQPSVKIPTGSTWYCSAPAPADAMQIIGATSAQAFTAWEW
ncbi:MAG TPA: hypothetical protein VGH84_08780 [Steroidobacteraceae bacterium]|jgi:hypothetical protein